MRGVGHGFSFAPEAGRWALRNEAIFEWRVILPNEIGRSGGIGRFCRTKWRGGTVILPNELALLRYEKTKPFRWISHTRAFWRGAKGTRAGSGRKLLNLKSGQCRCGMKLRRGGVREFIGGDQQGRRFCETNRRRWRVSGRWFQLIYSELSCGTE